MIYYIQFKWIFSIMLTNLACTEVCHILRSASIFSSPSTKENEQFIKRAICFTHPSIHLTFGHINYMVLRVRREHTEHTRPSVPTAACLSVHNNKIRERRNAAAAITARPYVLLHAIFSLVIHQFICHKNTGNLYTASYTLFFFLYLRKYLHFHLGGTQCVYAGGEASSSVVASKPIRRIVVFFLCCW